MILSRTASVESTIRLLEMAVTEKKKFADGVAALTPYDIAGTPDWIFMDGGPAFNNGEFRAVMKDLEVELELPPGGLPHLRGMVERMFRNVDQKLIARFEGRTFPNVVDKGDYDSVGRAGLTIDELGCALIRYVVDCHHNTPQAALGGETPRSCYMRLTKEHGVTPCPDDHRRRNVFGIDIERTLSAAGIRFLGIQYRSKQLQAHFMKVKNARLNCRVYAGNLGAISVKIGKSLLTVKAPPEFHKVDAETWVGAEKILQRRGAHMKKITRPIVLAAIEDFNRLAETGRRRADISDVPMSRNALLNAERSIKIFAKFPDELDDAADDGGDLYGGAIAVGAPKPRRTSAKAPKRRPRAAPTRVKTAKKPRRSSTPLRVPGRQTSKRKWKVKG
jgi:putative transposase